VIARGIRAARGRYICLLDGDDYWISPMKLERQAALLDAERDISACFHNASVVRDDRPTADRWTPATQPRRVTADDIWHGNPFATCAGMMRTSALHELGDWYDEMFPITDWPLYVLCSEHGDITFEDEVVGGYRLHDASLFSAQPSRAKLDMIAQFYRRMDAALDGRAHDRARAGASRYFFEWAKVHADQGDLSMGRYCLQLCRCAGGVGLSVGRREWARCAWRLWRRP
jgi:glycosyltransferase involved in cell wall biosynthesis